MTERLQDRRVAMFNFQRSLEMCRSHVLAVFMPSENPLSVLAVELVFGLIWLVKHTARPRVGFSCGSWSSGCVLVWRAHCEAASPSGGAWASVGRCGRHQMTKKVDSSRAGVERRSGLIVNMLRCWKRAWESDLN